MRPLQPPIHLLRAFVATARFGSISRAAQSLHLTQSAVSKQILDLESQLSVPLFQRIRGRLTLTPSGQRYAEALRPILAQLETATLEVMASQDGGGTLHLSVLPTFSARVLIPRLPGFQSSHPEVQLNFVPHVQGYDFQRTDLDCSVLYGTGHWPGAKSEYLAGHEVILIAPPGLAGRRRIRQPGDVQGHTLLHHTTVPSAWEEWFRAHGITGLNSFSGPHLDQYQVLIRAVSAGMGLALVPHCLVMDDIASGAVTAPLPQAFRFSHGYWLCYPEERAEFGPLLKFKQWLHTALAQPEQASCETTGRTSPQPEPNNSTSRRRSH